MSANKEGGLMDLNDRKRKILHAVIDEYIGTAEPVGSRAISKNKELGLSSATIRNEMADLEEMGYLMQPHTSAGRIPSDEGYRFYVESLMKRYHLGMEAIESLQNELIGRVSQLDRMIKKAGLIASALTDYTTFITAPETADVKLNKVDLINLGSSRAVLIVVTQTGVVRNRTMNLDIGAENCAKLSSIFSSELLGLSASEIDFQKIQNIERSIKQNMDIHPQILVAILNFVYETISALSNTEIFVDNVQSMLSFPEYNDVHKARRMLGFLDNKENIKKLLSSDEGIHVKIGNDNEQEALKDCSLVTVNYSLDGGAKGKIGVIGPKRMDYAKVFASLDFISTHIDKILNMYTDNKIPERNE